ncbi:NNP family nitrate/nitrite transporter-like MFS transporter [Anoxybacillus voinovskiensis]|uniref:NNP family nitrate/nitrite transporter-like MFS transporter n=1 Tax=Anoxybacteroides voinovskiense TaxID=230470 RepID=A0A840DQT2_9BACL|nr:nitrate/nitrite transporter [Anoxybacillus voinovskiensis]MBB4072398.1 NNP family nitrate/nitrite transporter-like MFS transporter [Anoxybacillus voinovskiensis]GGJ58215.1 nitrate transporter [Anoxybacillus voinovskiensis]
MERKSFLKSGHTPTLFSAFLYFDVSFMIWVLLGPLSVIIMNDFQMDAAQKANLVALPILGGSILRLVLGLLTDHIGPKKTAQIGMMITLIPLIWGWKFADHLSELYVVALLLGVAGASFAAALPLASRWYPPQYQGLAMGIAGAGNSGTVLTTLFANRIAQYYGDWHIVFAFALIPLVVTFFLFSVFAKDSPNQPAPQQFTDYMRVLKQRDAWLFCMFYSVTFGGFVGMSSYLTIFFNTQYGLDPVKAADFTTICVIAGSFFRPIGGWLADKFGGIRMLIMLYSMVAVMMAFLSSLPSLPVATAFLFIAMMSLGMGNGSVFQLVPQRFQKEIGVMTGIVGSAGGLGGYFLPKILGNIKLATGSFTFGFLVLSGIALLCLLLIAVVQRQWKKTWIGAGGKARVEHV